MLDDLQLTGMNYIQGHIQLEDENNVHLIAYHNDSVSKISWNKHTRSCKGTFSKWKPDMHFPDSLSESTGKKYTINDELCPSFVLFSASGEFILGVLIEDSIKFWSISHEISQVYSASFSDELGLTIFEFSKLIRILHCNFKSIGKIIYIF